jgi:hypothetical protein
MVALARVCHDLGNPADELTRSAIVTLTSEEDYKWAEASTWAHQVLDGKAVTLTTDPTKTVEWTRERFGNDMHDHSDRPSDRSLSWFCGGAPWAARRDGVWQVRPKLAWIVAGGDCGILGILRSIGAKGMSDNCRQTAVSGGDLVPSTGQLPRPASHSMALRLDAPCDLRHAHPGPRR